MATRKTARSTHERRAPGWLKLVNPINRFMVRRGMGPRPQHLLAVAGRRTGRTRTTPVAVIAVDGERYVVAGFDGSDWVKNVRAAGRGALVRGRNVEQVMLVEVPVGARGGILQAFAERVRGGTAFLTVPADALPDAFAAAAARHPVFHVFPVVDPTVPTPTE
jgi:deazaflavin-dependent oxidoreductase (nitroreductase family)